MSLYKKYALRTIHLVLYVVTLLIIISLSSASALEIDVDSNTAVDITYGGTNAATAAGARTNLELVKGTTIGNILEVVDTGGSTPGLDFTISFADLTDRLLANITDWPASVSVTEVGYLDGVTSGIQAQLNSATGSYIATAPTYSDESCTAGQYALTTTTGYVCVSSGDWNTWDLTDWNNPEPTSGTINTSITGSLAGGQVNTGEGTFLHWSEMTADAAGTISYAHWDTYSVGSPAKSYFQLYSLSGTTGTRVCTSAGQTGSAGQPDAYDIDVSEDSCTVDDITTYMVAVCIESDSTAFIGAYQAEPGSSGVEYYKEIADCTQTTFDTTGKTTGGASRSIYAIGDNSATR
jgi:hypothetical protein